jgi:Spy/CpxP family protein refolding chaperone
VSSNRFIMTAVLAAAVALPTAALAQQQPAPNAAPAGAAPAAGAHHRRGGTFRHAFAGITLTAQQQQQIRSAMEQTRQANQNADPQTRRANMQKLHTTIEGILTPPQRTQFEQNLAQMRQHRRAAHAHGPAPAASPAS